MASLFEELGLDEESDSQRLARELAEEDLDLVAAFRAIREHLNLSQTELGARMGVSQATVSSFESGESEPRLSTVRRYAHALGVHVRHSVIHEGSEFMPRTFTTAHWAGRSNPTATTPAQFAFEMGAAEAKRTDFAVAA